MYDVYSGKVYAPCLMYEGIEFGVVEVLHIEATDGGEAVVHVRRDVATQPVGATQVDGHAMRLWIVVQVEVDSAGGACAYVYDISEALVRVWCGRLCGGKCGGAGGAGIGRACAGTVP